jgi:ATP-binding cassette subfamily B protein
MAMHEEDVLGKAYDARLMRRLIGYLTPYRRHVVLASVAIVGHSIVELAPPLLTKRVLDRYIPAGDLVGLAHTAIIYLVVLLTSFGLDYLQTWTMQMAGQRIMFDLRMEIYGHLHRLDVQFFDRNPVGRLMTRVTTDVDALNELFTAGVVSVCGDLVTLVGIMGVLIWMDWRLALVAFSVLPLVALIAQWFRRNVRESYRTVRTFIARINAFLQERITGTMTVQLFRREARDFATFDEIDAANRDANVESIFYYAVFYPAVELVSALAASLIIWRGGHWVLEGTLTLGALVAFFQYSQRFFRPISDLSEKFNVLQAAMASSERIFALIDTPVAIESALPSSRLHLRPSDFQLRPSGFHLRPSGFHLRPSGFGGQAAPRQAGGAAGPGVIAFDHVTFSYVDGEPVLKDVSFEVLPGQRVGIVGATGSGKTTIMNLLLRFYDVQRGRVTIDGVDVRDMDLHQVRAKFGMVLQDVHLFSGTIADNVRLGNAAIDDAAVRRALEAVHANRFVDRLPLGAASVVAERGASLSVGEKQLLSFARALAFDPQVLILDEATSSVDTDTELLIRDALDVIMRGRTTIAIAHRLSTIQHMDRILVLHKGQLRESGTHDELLAQRGIYYRLFQLQFQSGERQTA